MRANRLANWTSTTSHPCAAGPQHDCGARDEPAWFDGGIGGPGLPAREGRGLGHLFTDETWRTNIRPFPFWNAAVYNDRFWKPAQTFGKLGDTVPWDRQEDVASTEVHRSERFRISREFQVQRVIDAEQTGSLIAMAFNEFGQIILSQEGGPLLLAVDSDKDEIVDTLQVYCEAVKNVQGILPLNGQIYVTGGRPGGQWPLLSVGRGSRRCIWRTAACLFNFEGEVGEHSAHGMTLGPDGLIYIVIGNHSSPLKEYAPSSPHRGYYEGDLVWSTLRGSRRACCRARSAGWLDHPHRLERRRSWSCSPAACATFTIWRSVPTVSCSFTTVTWSRTWERLGIVPTRVCHVLPGAELGWRSGWAKWPEYYVDSLPAIADTGRGSPTGAVFYKHHMFPQRYHNALFLADWSEGRILAVQLKPQRRVLYGQYGGLPGGPAAERHRSGRRS